MEKVKVIQKKVNDVFRQVEIDNSLEAMQKLVGGYIEVVHMFDNVCMVCNEEGKLMGLEPNLVLRNGDVVVGDIFFVEFDEEGEMKSFDNRRKQEVLVIGLANGIF